jgi:hypothetical protein
MPLIGTPVHEPAHGRADTTAMWATERDHGGRRTVSRRTQLALPRLVVPPAGGTTARPHYDSDELDA